MQRSAMKARCVLVQWYEATISRARESLSFSFFSPRFSFVRNIFAKYYIEQMWVLSQILFITIWISSSCIFIRGNLIHYELINRAEEAYYIFFLLDFSIPFVWNVCINNLSQRSLPYGNIYADIVTQFSTLFT